MLRRHQTYIALCLTTLVSLMVMSCASSARREVALMDSIAKDSIMKDSLLKVQAAESNLAFESDTLSAVRLQAFEVRATQKLKDMFDYLLIMADSTIEQSFKTQAKQMAIALFDSHENNVEMTLTENEKPRQQTIADFSDAIMASKASNIRFDIENIRPSGEIAKENGYKGQLSFLLTIYQTQHKKPVVIQHSHMTAHYIITRIKKTFGSDEKLVWEVLMGNISTTAATNQ